MERKTGSWTNSQKKNEKNTKRGMWGVMDIEREMQTKFMKKKESLLKRAHFVWRNL